MHELVNTQKAADLLGLSIHTLRQWRLLKIGPPYIKQGTKVQYSTRDLAEWFERCRHTPDTQGSDNPAH